MTKRSYIQILCKHIILLYENIRGYGKRNNSIDYKTVRHKEEEQINYMPGQGNHRRKVCTLKQIM